MEQARELSGRIESVIPKTDANAAASYRVRVDQLCRRIAARSQSVRAQIEGRDQTLAFDGTGAAILTDWTEQNNSGVPTFSRKTIEDRSVLGIAVRQSSSGSWRTEVLLKRGPYRLSGRAKLKDVTLDASDARAFAGIRISHGAPQQKRSGTFRLA